MIRIQCKFLVCSSQDIKIKIIVLHKNPGLPIYIELVNDSSFKILTIKVH